MKVKATLKRFGAMCYKNRSNIEFVAGLLLETAGVAVIISKATKAAEVTEEVSRRLEDVRLGDEENAWESEEERKAEKRDILKYAVVGYTKTYALGVGFVIGGMALNVVSKITDNNTISEAYALVASTAAAFSQYRQRVIADVGEEKDQEYLLGPQVTTVDILPDGTVIQTTEPVENPNGGANLPPHCVMFDESNQNWTKEPGLNRDFLEDCERWLNKRLQYEDFLFENDIRRYIGAPLVKCGWTAGIFATDKDGNINRLKFGLDAKNPAAQRFRDGVEPSIILQFNVEDNILEQMNWRNA